MFQSTAGSIRRLIPIKEFLMRVKLSTINKVLFISAFFIYLLSPLLYLNITGKYSIENRYLQEFPLPPAGYNSSEQWRAFIKNFESWFNDRIGFRETMVAAWGILHVEIFKIPHFGRLFIGSHNRIFLDGSVVSMLNVKNFNPSLLPGKRDNPAYHAKIISEKLVNMKKYFQLPIAIVNVPQRPILDFQYLPYFLRKFTAKDVIKNHYDKEIIDLLSDEARQLVIYPIDEAVKENTVSPLYPIKNFHWTSSRYTKLAASKIAEYFQLGKYESPGLADFETGRVYSDIIQFSGFPMYDDTALVYKNNIFDKLGIACDIAIADVYPELRFLPTSPYSPKYAVNKNMRNGPRILALGNSFTPQLANDLARYFQECLAVEASIWPRQWDENIDHSQKIKNWTDTVLRVYRPDYIIIVTPSLSVYSGFTEWQ
jgi:hypothetical protein